MPIIIRGNDDIRAQGWSGSGTISNPYIIENLNITSDERAIEIWDTTVHILIRNCVLKSNASFVGGFGIYVWNSTNIRMESCEIYGMAVAIEVDYSRGITIKDMLVNTINNMVTLGAIRMVSVNNSIISQNVIQGPQLFDGISTSYCLNISTVGNIVIDSRSSIMYYRTNHSIIAGNVLFNNTYGIELGSHCTANRVYYNSIIACVASSSLDNGFNNIWDDGISRGNGWSDYNKSGVYPISGSSMSVDRYPHFLPTIIDYDNIDSDGDMIPDAWEVSNGYNSINPQVPLDELLLYHLPLILGIFVLGAALTGVGIYLSRPYLEKREKMKKERELEDEARKAVDELNRK